MRLIDAEKLFGMFVEKAWSLSVTEGKSHGAKYGDNWLLDSAEIKQVIDSIPDVKVHQDSYVEGFKDGFDFGFRKGKELREADDDN